MPASTVLVSGATGFLGSHLCRQFVLNGDSVVGLKRPNSDTRRLSDLGGDFRLVNFDDNFLATRAANMPALKTVVHAATCYGRRGESAATVFDANVAYPLSLITLAANASAVNFVNIDTTLPSDLNEYSRTKRHFLNVGNALAKRKGINFINIRLEYMYGAWDDDSKFPTRVIRACAANEPELNLTLGEQQRDFIYVDDVVAGISRVISSSNSAVGEPNEFELGSGTAVTLRDFATTVRSLTKSQTRLNFGAIPYRHGEVMFSRANTERMERLGWRSMNTLLEGIQKTLDIEKRV